MKKISRINTVRCLKLRMQNFGANYTYPCTLGSPSKMGGLGSCFFSIRKMWSEMKGAGNQRYIILVLRQDLRKFLLPWLIQMWNGVWVFFSHFNTKSGNTTGGGMCSAQSNQGLPTHFVRSAGDLCLLVSITGGNKLLSISNNKL